jgi:hypothetical protein
MSDSTPMTAVTEKRKSIWDNDLPPGDSPAMSKGPLVAASIVYAAWMVFLVSMMVVRLMTA